MTKGTLLCHRQITGIEIGDFVDLNWKLLGEKEKGSWLSLFHRSILWSWAGHFFHFCCLLLLVDRDSWFLFVCFFLEYNLVMALKRTHSYVFSAVIFSPQRIVMVSFFKSLGSGRVMGTFLLLLGKSINEATGCISGISGSTKAATNTGFLLGDFTLAWNRARHMAYVGSDMALHLE